VIAAGTGRTGAAGRSWAGVCDSSVKPPLIVDFQGKKGMECWEKAQKIGEGIGSTGEEPTALRSGIDWGTREIGEKNSAEGSGLEGWGGKNDMGEGGCYKRGEGKIREGQKRDRSGESGGAKGFKS